MTTVTQFKSKLPPEENAQYLTTTCLDGFDAFAEDLEVKASVQYEQVLTFLRLGNKKEKSKKNAGVA